MPHNSWHKCSGSAPDVQCVRSHFQAYCSLRPEWCVKIHVPCEWAERMTSTASNDGNRFIFDCKKLDYRLNGRRTHIRAQQKWCIVTMDFAFVQLSPEASHSHRRTGEPEIVDFEAKMLMEPLAMMSGHKRINIKWLSFVSLRFTQHQINGITLSSLLLLFFHSPRKKCRDLFGWSSKLSNLHLVQDVTRVNNTHTHGAEEKNTCLPNRCDSHSLAKWIHGITVESVSHKTCEEKKHIFCELFKFRQTALSSSKQRFRYSPSSMDTKNMIEYQTFPLLCYRSKALHSHANENYLTFIEKLFDRISFPLSATQRFEFRSIYFRLFFCPKPMNQNVSNGNYTKRRRRKKLI